MGLGPERDPGRKTLWAFRIRKSVVEVTRIHLAAFLRVSQSIIGLIMFCVLGTIQYHYLTDVNPAFDVEAFVGLIIAAITFWFYGFVIVALEIDAVVSKLPAPVRSLLRDRFHLLQAAVDAAATILFLALGVRSFRAIHSPVCGGIFVRDFCYTVPDVCVMSKVGNANLRAFHCPLSKLASGCAFSFIMAAISLWSSYVAWILHMGRSRLRALGALHSPEESEGLRTSLLVGVDPAAANPPPAAGRGPEPAAGMKGGPSSSSQQQQQVLEALDSMAMAEQGQQQRSQADSAAQYM